MDNLNEKFYANKKVGYMYNNTFICVQNLTKNDIH